MRTKALIILLAIQTLFAFGATEDTLRLSLEACLENAINHNLMIKNALLGQEIADRKAGMVRSQMLPQVHAVGNFHYYPDVPVLAVDGELLGQPDRGTINVEAGTTWDVSYGIHASQMLFNRQHQVRLSMAREEGRLQQLHYQETKEDVLLETARRYYQVLILRKEMDNLIKELDRLKSLIEMGEVRLKTDMITPLELDRLRVSHINVETRLERLRMQEGNLIRSLKLMMGMATDQPVAIRWEWDPGIIGRIESLVLEKDQFLQNIQFEILRSQKMLVKSHMKNARSEYLPVLSGIARYNQQTLTNAFDLVGPASNWFSVSLLGIRLDMPLFEGLRKNEQLQKARLEFRQIENLERHKANSLQIQYENALSSYRQAFEAIQVQQENEKLAEAVYEKTHMQYLEEMASLTDLIDAGNALSEARHGLDRSLLQYKVAELELLYTSGEITRLLPDKK